jgi:acetyl-CoA C-acetyltransferase
VTDDRTPILVGAGQITQRDVEPERALEPVALMAAAARAAAEDAGGGERLLRAADRIVAVNTFCVPYGNLPQRLAEEIGAHPTEEIYTTIGGNTPQAVVNLMATRVAAGEADVVVLAGGEAMRSVRQAHGKRLRLRWGGGDGTPTVVGDPRDGTSAQEIAHGLMLPTAMYPLFENAIRARRGWSLDEHRRRLGVLYAGFSEVAATHPQAWFPQRRSADEIATVTADNRMIAFPYPKLMNAIIEVDQAAAVIMTSVGRARTMGIAPSRWVYPWAGAEAHDRWFVSERADHAVSPAIASAGRAALDAAGVTIDQIAHFDLYSCFPSAVQIGRDMLGIPEHDPRPLTVTGGLAYFGGPGNNYSMHAIATTCDRLRAAPGTIGLVSALGWYITKHAIGIYGATPPKRPWRAVDGAALQRTIDSQPGVVVVEQPNGAGTIETYTVVYGRDGAPMRGIVLGRLDDGRRFLANTPSDRTLLESLTRTEAIGRRGRVAPDGETNRFDLA